MDFDTTLVEDTGFNLHCDVNVGRAGLRPGYRDVKKIKKLLKDVAKKDGVAISSFEEKWFDTSTGSVWVLGVR